MTYTQVIKNCTGGKADPNFPEAIKTGRLRDGFAFELAQGEIPGGDYLWAVSVFCWLNGAEDRRARKLRRVFRNEGEAHAYVASLKHTCKSRYLSNEIILRDAENGRSI